MAARGGVGIDVGPDTPERVSDQRTARLMALQQALEGGKANVWWRRGAFPEADTRGARAEPAGSPRRSTVLTRHSLRIAA